MRNVFMAVVLLTVSSSAYPRVVSTAGPPVNARPAPPTEYEFYWDDGIMTHAWCWYSGGSYWAVDFDEEKTGGQDGHVTRIGVGIYPGWPDGYYQGFYMHIFSDYEHWWGYHPGGDFWMDVEPPHPVSPRFFVAAEQIGNYPNCDAIGADAVAGTHNWTGYQGSWSPVTQFGDFIIRCYWDDGQEEDFVSDATWGSIKALY